MERSDEARREDSLYDSLGSAERKNEKLEAENKELKKMIISSRMRKLCWCDSCGEKRDARQIREKLYKELEQELKGITNDQS